MATPSYNKTLLMGNLTRDPELRYTPKGTATAKIGLAVNRQWKSESGEKKEEVTFIDIEAWGRQAEVIAQYCKKGSQLFVEGRLKLDTWDDKQTGKKQYKLKVVLESFSFIGGKSDQKTAASSEPAQPPQPKSGFTTDGKIDDPELPPSEPDDVPF
jgi:single-strand DNA-binding protein